MPPLECANFLEGENKTVCVAPFGSLRLSFWIQPQFFPSYTRKLSQFTLLSFFFLFSFFFGKKGLECDSMWNYRRLTRNRYLAHIPENVIPGDFSQKKNGKQKKKRKKRKKTRSTTVLWSAKILQSAWILQYVYVPSCGVRCPMWSAKNLWNAKNSEYAWLV